MKKLLCLLLCAVLLLSTAACSREAGPTEPTEPPTRPVVEVELGTAPRLLKYEGVELQFVTMLWELDPEAEILRLAAADFEQTTGAKVQISWLAGSETELEAVLAGGQKVDIFEAPGSLLSDHLDQYAMDLTELAANARYEEKSWPVLTAQILERCDTLKAIAYRPCLYGLYYNREAFDKLGVEVPPSTWEEYLAFCQTLKDNGYEGLVIDQERAHLVLELLMERALGWEGIRDTMLGEKWRSDEMAMTMIQEAIGFAEKGYLVKGTPAAHPNGQNRLGQSNAVFVAGPTQLCAEVERYCLADMKWGVMPHPGNGPGSGLLVDADVLAVKTDCEEAEAAFDFVMLLTTGPYDQLRADMEVGIPADPSNSSVIAGADSCMTMATAKAPRWFLPDHSELFCRLWNGYYKTGSYFAGQLNLVSHDFDDEKSVG